MEILKSGGCEIISDEYWNDFDTLLLRKGEDIFTLTLEAKYFCPVVVTKYRELGIAPPEDHLHFFNQHFTPEELCYCGQGRKFIECHGKSD